MMKLKVLSPDGIAQIDKAARTMLERTGVQLPHEKMIDLFEKAGAKVDRTSGMVKIPSKLIDECLAKAGKTFTTYGRDRNKTAVFGKGKRNYNSSAGQAHWLDSDGTRRPPTLEDVANAAKIGDVLPYLTIVGPMADPNEIDVSYRCVEVGATQFRITDKPLIFWLYDGPSAKFVVELFNAVAGSAEETTKYPAMCPIFEPVSPLRFETNSLDIMFEVLKIPLPISVAPIAQMGLSAPGTVAGTVAQETAEALAGICAIQLIRPGAPVSFAGICHAFDMKTTQMIFGGPEQGLMAVAVTQMANHYGLSSCTNVILVDSKCVDAQAGLESAASLLMGALAGSDIFGHLGIAGVDQAGSLEMLVFQHEVVEYVERIMRSFEVDTEHIGLDVIDQVGPGGSFIDRMHTAEHFREELWMPTMLDRSYWPAWEDAGKPSLADKLPARVEQLLNSYQPKPLPDNVEKDVARIIDDARKHLSN